MRTWYITTFIVLIALLAGGVLPTWKANKVARTELVTLTADLEKRVQELKSLETQSVEDQQRQKDLAKRIPVELNQGSIIRDIRDIAQKTGFVFKTIQFREGINSDTNSPEISAQFQVDGPSDRIISFLTAIERNDPFFGMSSLQVTQDPETNVSVLNVDLYSFSLR